MPMYRCYGCRREFEAAKPICEPCGIDAVANPRDKEVVVRLVTIHLDPPGRRVGVGKNHAACDPTIKLGAKNCQFTAEPSAVTCPKCKATDVFAAVEEGGAAASELFLSRPVTKKE